MPKHDPEIVALRAELAGVREELAAALAQNEALQSAAADAEARAATAKEQLAEERQRAAGLEADLEEARVQLAGAQEQLAALRQEAAEVRAQLREAVLKYREARLAGAPEVPPDLVPGETMEEIDRQMEAAQQMVSQLREKLRQEEQSARVPLGAPPRRPPDLSAISTTEKIRLGLQQLADR